LIAGLLVPEEPILARLADQLAHCREPDVHRRRPRLSSATGGRS
jgi:hypothetical protein